MRANLKLNPNLADSEHSEDESGSNSAGQSGDIQGISDVADADFESVEELVEEGNSFEAAAVEGVENAKDPDVSEVTTRQVPEDDVPEEYRNAD
ncbi:MAG: hypothetical protein ABSA80_15425 [Terriglobales bacterium]|jgi:hypothetical protein